MNETSRLLAHSNNSSYHETATNLLVATRQLEAFAMKYAMEHLTTNGTPNANITRTGEHFGELLFEPTLKLYAKLNTPSTIYKDLYRGATPRETT